MALAQNRTKSCDYDLATETVQNRPRRAQSDGITIGGCSGLYSGASPPKAAEEIEVVCSAPGQPLHALRYDGDLHTVLKRCGSCHTADSWQLR
jgi:hypothetical protein